MGTASNASKVVHITGLTASNFGQRQYLCPDLLTIEHIGAADNLRGRVVRGFFRVMEWIPWR